MIAIMSIDALSAGTGIRIGSTAPNGIRAAIGRIIRGIIHRATRPIIMIEWQPGRPAARCTTIAGIQWITNDDIEREDIVIIERDFDGKQWSIPYATEIPIPCISEETTYDICKEKNGRLRFLYRANLRTAPGESSHLRWIGYGFRRT